MVNHVTQSVTSVLFLFSYTSYDWRHVPLEINPYLISRGTRANKLIDKRIWIEEPEFFKLPPQRWPKVKKLTMMKQCWNPSPQKGNMSLLACVSADDGVNRLIISHLFVGH